MAIEDPPRVPIFGNFGINQFGQLSRAPTSARPHASGVKKVNFLVGRENSDATASAK